MNLNYIALVVAEIHVHCFVTNIVSQGCKVYPHACLEKKSEPSRVGNACVEFLCLQGKLAFCSVLIQPGQGMEILSRKGGRILHCYQSCTQQASKKWRKHPKACNSAAIRNTQCRAGERICDNQAVNLLGACYSN